MTALSRERAHAEARRNGAATPGIAQIITAYQVLGRLIDCVLFRHTGVVYEEPPAEITTDYLLPSNDDCSLAVDEYQRRQRLAPGQATRAFLEQF